ncbi:MAG: competence type IV pilus assembly protein ComGB [Streptococcus minor]|nr:competence type IV pilus assembly protein ComGB [Streptococcus minor]
MISFLRTDISIFGRQKPKKLSILGQRKVIQLFNNLFASGFHLSEIVDFLKRSHLLADSYITVLRQGLMAGKPFSALLSDLAFSDAVVTQISLAEIHGNTALSLRHIEDYLTKMAQVRKKLIEVATYPVILLGFLMVIMLGLKNYLLPQLEEGNVATSLVNHFPQIFLGALFFLACIVLISLIWMQQTSKVTVARVLSRMPFLGTYVKIYLTAYYAREWGNLIGQGLELGQIVDIMQEQKSALFQEIGRDLAQSFINGQSFCDQILTYPFFRRELSLIIEYGQAKSKLGAELSLYADECWEEFFTKVNRAMQLIQPLIFLFVALMIVLIYAAMLLPIYQNMEI